MALPPFKGAAMTQVQIINLGLAQISQAPITSLSDGSVQADAANTAWIPCLQEVLRGNNWPFATVIEDLVEVVGYTPPTGWQFAYVYPVNALSVWKVSDDFTDSKSKGQDFRKIYVPSLAAQVILTNCLDAGVEYTYYVSDTNMFDADFISMLAYRLAAAMAMPLNADADQAINMMKIYMGLLSDAQRQSSYENNVNNGQSVDTIVNARVSGNNGANGSVSIGGMTFDQFNQGN